MSSYVGVVTTGIYCCPGACGGRPLERNRRWFDSSAAAEAAGYRACFQCRPYRTQPGWSLTAPELVCRALHRVLDGALDGDGTEAQLAADVGASPRHLRRLFLEHLGVTPTQLGRSARAHFARRLIDDTDLTFVEIAHLAAFGSVRQFNTTMRKAFRASPTDLRAKRRRSDRLIADGGLAVRLPFQPPLEFAALLDQLAGDAIRGVSCIDNFVYRRTIRIGGDVGMIEIEEGDESHLHATLHLPHWREVLHHVQLARRLFDLDTNPEHSDHRTIGHWDLFELGVAFLARNDAGGIDHTLRRVVEAHGQPIAGLHQYGLSHAFPTPQSLARADIARQCETPESARSINAFAQGVVQGTIRLDRGVTVEHFVRSVSDVDPISSALATMISRRLNPRLATSDR